MSKLSRSLVLAAIAAAFVAGSVGAATVQENRSAAMKQLGKNLKPLGAIAKGEAEYTMSADSNAKAIEQISKGILVLFPEGSGGGKSRAKPEIWSDWAGFTKAAKNFQAAAPGLVAAAKTGDSAKIGAAVKAVGKTCGGCHKPFRAPKKKK